MTPERFARLVAVLDRRQPDLTVVMDNVHKTHNLSAVLRSADAVGIMEVHATFRDDPPPLSRGPARGAQQWVELRRYGSIGEAAALLHQRGFAIVAADPDPSSIDFREADYTGPTALLLGQERDGVSDEGLGFADVRVSIPMHGFSASLNVSVAAALILFEAERQRERGGMYAQPRLNEERRAKLLFEWAHPDVAAACRERNLKYPRLDDQGHIVEKLPFA